MSAPSPSSASAARRTSSTPRRCSGLLRQSGFELVSDHDDADAVVINTCGFLEASKEESLEVIGEAIERKRARRVQRVVVAGCLVQRHRARLLEWAPEIDAMIGVFDRDHIVDAVARRPRAAHDRRSPMHPISRAYWIAGNALQAARERGRATVGLTVQRRATGGASATSRTTPIVSG